MISRGFQNLAHHQGMHMFPVTTEDLVSANSVEVAVNSASGSSSGSSSSSSSSHSSTLLFNLSVLKDKLSQVQTLVGVILSPDQSLPESTSMAVSSMNSTIQEIIVTASSMMFTCQQMAPSFPSPPGTNELHHQSEQHQRMNHHSSSHNYGTNNNRVVLTTIGTEHNNIRGQGFFTSTESEALDWFGETYNNNNNNNNNSNSINCKLKGEDDIDKSVAISDSKMSPAGDDDIDENNNVNEGYGGNYDIIELDASDLLAKYTHYCQVCGKGFKRDANLRMHMRAHGDEYKTSAALSNPLKNIGGRDECLMSEIMMKPKKYSCPQQGCRWNKKHAKFQPLKSMICAKNHYKRSHCPKMYVCKRCNQKQFSVLSDLRTHEKHCGDLKWQCSCGTTFSRKDKLMGHVALFVGHTPCPNSTSSTNGIIMLPPFSAGKLQLQNVDGT